MLKLSAAAVEEMFPIYKKKFKPKGLWGMCKKCFSLSKTKMRKIKQVNALKLCKYCIDHEQIKTKTLWYKNCNSGQFQLSGKVYPAQKGSLIWKTLIQNNFNLVYPVKKPGEDAHKTEVGCIENCLLKKSE